MRDRIELQALLIEVPDADWAEAAKIRVSSFPNETVIETETYREIRKGTQDTADAINRYLERNWPIPPKA